MTVSPGVTRLDRVLDLVTDHEAQFRDHELRVVDLSARVAAVERAVGGTEARSVAFADGTPYGATSCARANTRTTRRLRTCGPR